MTSSAKKTGIYGIFCEANGKWYVGQAQYIRRRNTEERRELNAGRCHNRHLQHAWDKYGADAFRWEILELCQVEELDRKEQEWVEKLQSYSCGFNKTIGGGGVRGYKLSTEARRALSARNSNGKSPRLGKPISEESKLRMRLNALGGNSPKAKAVIQLSKTGEYIARYPSVADAERATGAKHIPEVCYGRPKRKTSGGYRWKWEAEA